MNKPETPMCATNMPSTLGKYRIEKVLGEGGMGTVYQAFDPDLKRTVAIKTVRPALLGSGDGENQDYLARFRREAQAAAALNHPNIVTIHDYGEDNGTPYIAMECIEGRDLKDLSRGHGPPALGWALNVMRQVLEGLKYCHDQGVIHRDLKLANIIFLPDGLVKITDFGIARVEGSDLTRAGIIVGTPSSMSPEQVLGEPVDARSDLFSAGAVLYELLTGEKPFPGKVDTEIMYKVLSTPPQADATQWNPHLPAAVNDLLRKALAKRPEDRFQSADEFSRALQQLSNHPQAEKQDEQATLIRTQAVLSRTASTNGEGSEPRVSRPSTRRTRRSLLRMATVFFLVASAGLIGWLFWEKQAREHSTLSGAEHSELAGRGLDLSKPEESVPADAGSIHVVTYPPGATIWLENRPLGTTPHSFQLPPGNYDVVIRLDGYQDLPANLEVEGSADIDFELALTKSSNGP